MTQLRQRMTEDMQVRNLALNTQTSYLQQVSLFARYFKKSPEALGPEEIRTYQVYLTNERKLAPGSILIAIAALRFLCKVSLKKDWIFEDVIPALKKPQKLSVVLSPEEVLHFLSCVGGTMHRAILTTCYAAGLRISEVVRLKPTHYFRRSSKSVTTGSRTARSSNSAVARDASFSSAQFGSSPKRLMRRLRRILSSPSCRPRSNSRLKTLFCGSGPRTAMIGPPLVVYMSGRR